MAAIQHSCNVYFWKLSERIGIDTMAEVARAVRDALPEDWGDAAVRVQVRRIEQPEVDAHG